MFKPSDDLFACGVAEPQASTICSVAIIDDLIVAGVIAAVSIAASQAAASSGEGQAKDEAGRQKDWQMRQMAMDYYSKRAKESAAAAGLVSRAEGSDAWAKKLAIQTGYADTMRNAERQADNTRMQGYINAGAGLASSITGSAMKSARSAGSDIGDALTQSGGASFGDRVGGYDLDPNSSQLLGGPSYTPSAPISATDPSGGYQLQPSDYHLLSGGQYAESPYGDDPYGTAPITNNPRRRFSVL